MAQVSEAETRGTDSAGDMRRKRRFRNRQQRVLDWSVIIARRVPLAKLKGEPEILRELDHVRAEAAEGS